MFFPGIKPRERLAVGQHLIAIVYALRNSLRAEPALKDIDHRLDGDLERQCSHSPNPPNLLLAKLG